MIFEKKFQEFKDKFADADTKKLTEAFAMQVNMTDEDCGGIFYIANIDGVFSVEPYDYVDRTSEIIGLSTEIKKVFAGRIGLEKAMAEGKVTVYGNPADVAAVQALLKKPTAKKPAKKAAEKKEATPKKEVVKEAAPKKEVAKKEAAPKKTEEKKPTAKKTTKK